ncbi:unnamed protein product [Amoebophrya sp. A25]|nr:unnamed protein product [Amoebophrya sp. A25]|eukprot:GSA25T00004327001.1
MEHHITKGKNITSTTRTACCTVIDPDFLPELIETGGAAPDSTAAGTAQVQKSHVLPGHVRPIVEEPRLDNFYASLARFFMRQRVAERREKHTAAQSQNTDDKYGAPAPGGWSQLNSLSSAQNVKGSALSEDRTGLRSGNQQTSAPQEQPQPLFRPEPKERAAAEEKAHSTAYQSPSFDSRNESTSSCSTSTKLVVAVNERIDKFLEHPEWTAPSMWIERVPILLANKLGLWKSEGGFDFDEVDLQISNGGPELLRSLGVGDSTQSVHSRVLVAEIGMFPLLASAMETTGILSPEAPPVDAKLDELQGRRHKSSTSAAVISSPTKKADEKLSGFPLRIVGTTFMQQLEQYFVLGDHAQQRQDFSDSISQRQESASASLSSLPIGSKIGILSYGSCDSYLLQRLLLQDCPRQLHTPGTSVTRTSASATSFSGAEVTSITTRTSRATSLSVDEVDSEPVEVVHDEKHRFNVVPLGHFYGKADVLLNACGGQGQSKVDASFLTDPQLSLALDNGCRILRRLGDDFPRFQWGALVASREVLETERGRAVVSQLLSVYTAAVQLMDKAVLRNILESRGEAVESEEDLVFAALLALGPEHFGVSEHMMKKALARCSGYALQPRDVIRSPVVQAEQHHDCADEVEDNGDHTTEASVTWQVNPQNFDVQGAVECLRLVQAASSRARNTPSSSETSTSTRTFFDCTAKNDGKNNCCDKDTNRSLFIRSLMDTDLLAVAEQDSAVSADDAMGA